MNKPNVFILLVALLSFSLFQCEKGDGENNSNPYVGEWELISVTGGFAGNGWDADFNTLVLKDDANYRISQNDTLVATGTYLLYDKSGEDWIAFTTVHDGPPHIFENEDKMIGFSIEGTLVLAEPCCDMYQYEFRKKGSDDD